MSRVPGNRQRYVLAVENTHITIADVLNKLRDDLHWRGSSDKTLDHIILTREEAGCIIKWAFMIILERDDLLQHPGDREVADGLA